MIIKPCTKAEVTFYESVPNHPAFAAYMPTFMGTLSLDAHNQQAQAAAAGAAGTTAPSLIDVSTIPVAAPVAPGHSRNISIPSARPGTPGHGRNLSIPQPQWTPSGGKALTTNLSIVLENAAAGFVRPNILDVKLGARLWDDDAPPAKRQKLDATASETTSGSLGFRIAGMKVYKGLEKAGKDNVDEDGYQSYDKLYGRKFKADDVRKGFEEYLWGASGEPNANQRNIARRLAEEVRGVQRALENEESRMYSASILFVYEGDQEALARAFEEEKHPRTRSPPSQPANAEADDYFDDDDDDDQITLEVGEDGQISLEDIANLPDLEDGDMGAEEGEEEEEDVGPPKVHAVKVIDFAHARWVPGQGPDDNTLMGVRSVLKILEELARDDCGGDEGS